MFTNNTEDRTSNGKMKTSLIDKITCCLLDLGLGQIIAGQANDKFPRLYNDGPDGPESCATVDCWSMRRLMNSLLTWVSALILYAWFAVIVRSYKEIDDSPV